MRNSSHNDTRSAKRRVEDFVTVYILTLAVWFAAIAFAVCR
jgi:hypothetical protein